MKPRKSKVSGLPSPLRFRFCSVYRPNSIRRIFSGCSSSLNFPSRSPNCTDCRQANHRADTRPDLPSRLLWIYRPGRSAKQAIAVTRKRCWKFDWAVEFDIKAVFDQIDHGLLLRLCALTSEKAGSYCTSNGYFYTNTPTGTEDQAIPATLTSYTQTQIVRIICQPIS